MWLIATMQPPVAGIFSPSIQVREVAASSVGLRMDAATVMAQPRSCSSFLTRTVTSPLSCPWNAPSGRRSLRREQATRSDGSWDASAALSSGGRIGGDVHPHPAPDPTPDAPRRCVVVVPVKPPALGKSRLVGLSDEQRRELAEAFALDTVQAAAQTRGVAAVLVVTDDFRLAAAMRGLDVGVGVEVMPDGASEDLNATLVQAAAEVVRRWPGAVPVALCADLPGPPPGRARRGAGRRGRGGVGRPRRFRARPRRGGDDDVRRRARPVRSRLRAGIRGNGTSGRGPSRWEPPRPACAPTSTTSPTWAPSSSPASARTRRGHAEPATGARRARTGRRATPLG